MRKFAFASSFLTLLAAVPALAADLPANSKLDAVTVFPDGAKITRTAEIELPAGETSVVLHNMPLSLDPNSLRVSGKADTAMQLGAVESRVVLAAKDQGASAAKLEKLKLERATLVAAIEALEVKKTMITRFAQSGPERQTGDIGLDKWSAVWNEVGSNMATVTEELRRSKARIQELDLEIQTVDPSRAAPNATQTRDITIALRADAATKATLSISYSISGASWTPLYDARLDTANLSLDVARRAIVRQRTGEDWNNVDLTLSTIRTNRTTAAPELVSERLNFFEPVIAYDSARAAAAGTLQMKRKSDGTGQNLVMEDAPAAAPAPAAPAKMAEEVAAQTSLGTYAASYHLAGRLTVPSDASQKNLLISTKTLAPKMKLLTTPALDATAFISLETPNELDGALLAGDVTLLRDDTYIGKGHIAFTETGDSFTLGFGADDKVKVTRAPVKKKENEPVWYNQTKQETREFKTSVKNLHDFAVSVQVLDRIPVSENTSITVDQLPLTTPPTEKQVGDKRGVMSWTLDLAPNEAKDIRLGYKIKYPADREIISGQ